MNGAVDGLGIPLRFAHRHRHARIDCVVPPTIDSTPDRAYAQRQVATGIPVPPAIRMTASWRNWQTRWIQNPFPKRSEGSSPSEATDQLALDCYARAVARGMSCPVREARSNRFSVRSFGVPATAAGWARTVTAQCVRAGCRLIGSVRSDVTSLQLAPSDHSSFQ